MYRILLILCLLTVSCSPVIVQKNYKNRDLSGFIYNSITHVNSKTGKKIEGVILGYNIDYSGNVEWIIQDSKGKIQIIPEPSLTFDN